MQRSVVVFPAPFGPRSPTISPPATVKERPVRAAHLRSLLVRFWTTRWTGASLMPLCSARTGAEPSSAPSAGTPDELHEQRPRQERQGGEKKRERVAQRELHLIS